MCCIVVGVFRFLASLNGNFARQTWSEVGVESMDVSREDALLTVEQEQANLKW